VGRAGSAGRNPQAGASVSAALGRWPVVARSGCRLVVAAAARSRWWCQEPRRALAVVARRGWRLPPRQGAAGGAMSPGRALVVAASEDSNQEICVMNLMCAYLCDGLISVIRVMNFSDLCFLNQFSLLSLFLVLGPTLVHQWSTVPRTGPERPEGP
jgi:hypothetical protein